MQDEDQHPCDDETPDSDGTRRIHTATARRQPRPRLARSAEGRQPDARRRARALPGLGVDPATDAQAAGAFGLPEGWPDFDPLSWLMLLAPPPPPPMEATPATPEAQHEAEVLQVIHAAHGALRSLVPVLKRLGPPQHWHRLGRHESVTRALLTLRENLGDLMGAVLLSE